MSDRVVVVTGAFGALGRTVVQRLSEAGNGVVAVDHAPTAPQGLAVARTISGVDLTDAAQAQQVLEAVAGEFGGIDALVNIAGGFVWETVDGNSNGSWERMHALNLMTALNASRAALPWLVQGGSGRIVNIGAKAALAAATGMGAYAASKAGVHRLTEALADEYKGRVTVNAVLPSIIDTPANRKDMPDADWSTWVRADELAVVIGFLVSEDASGITGALIPVTGRV
ncbi:MAG TPA: SDR family NAD(P)-dependent oxidoreductase [Brevundimonas sp.]|uniref:SDR family NAD(P)-dependent oxidoreductase n=1 Tax=Brevundimonas sp. TaxID=1871086 RepID=UPI002C74795C|nr:SDR family NAD(P)-dependent oxidoreductase [Brevundimonas sp.]HRH19669.1 SDR family NAD(P)-dependent oxidoreductase [Brevundimonas sp.]